MAVDYTLLGIIIVGGLFITASVVSMKFIIFNVKLLFRVMTWKKQNVGLVFMRNLGNSWGLPEIVNISDNKVENKNEFRIFSREQFKEGSWFGYPYILTDREDCKTSYGLYKAQCDDEGHPLTHNIFSGQKNEMGKDLYIETKIPVLSAVKTSVSVNPHLMKTVIAGGALNSAIKDFLDKNKYLLYCAGAGALFSAGALFFAYNNQNTIAQFCGEQLTLKTDKVIQVCQTVITNLTKI
jgi:hypothetical protein